MAIINVNGISGINSITAQSTSLNFYTAAGNNLPITAETLNVGTGASVSSPATNVLVLGTNSVERVRIDSSGNLGIGLTNPDEILCVTKTSPDPFNTVSTHLKLINAGGNQGAGNRIQFVTGAATAWIQSLVSGANSANGSDLVFGTPSTGTVGTERLRINSSGNVGIGTANPAVPLSISGTGGGAYLDILNGGDIRLFPAGQYTGSSQNVYIWCDAASVLSIGGTILPGLDNTYSLGSTSLRWAHIYTADLHMSNEGFQNDIDGTWGKYTIQEGENDLFLINRRTGKRYKFLLEEVK